MCERVSLVFETNPSAWFTHFAVHLIRSPACGLFANLVLLGVVIGSF
jgi:hypothetical protein